MKQKIAVLLAFTMLLTTVLLPSCSDDSKDPDQAVDQNIVSLIKDGAAVYTVVRSADVARDSDLMAASTDLKTSLKLASGVDFKSSTDFASTTEVEILLGATDREESQRALAELGDNEYVIRIDGDKIVICGASDALTVRAVQYFIDTYVTPNTALTLPKDLNDKQAVDPSISLVHNKTYVEMGDEILRAFDSYHRESNGNLKDTEFWDAAEILEAYLDAYEQTANPEYLEWAESIARNKFGASNLRTDWSWNDYNDDIAWACIAFARLYSFTGNANYYHIAKNNFDTMWDRAYTPDVLGGGLYWKMGEPVMSKNSCIQCPASIAACLLGKLGNDDSYYEKAKELMEWEFEYLFVEETGQVYDNITVNNELKDWRFTYNQGTFVGACMMLHEKYGDQKYLDYANKSIEFSRNELGNVNGVYSCETTGLDSIGFKGILTRWFYRFAEYTDNREVLEWLQLNADTAYGNRNSDNWIWTNWAEPTNPGGAWDDKDAENGKYDIWGLSAAIALLFNCEPWW